ncbi:MFS transporter [Nonomuraea sp. NPDC050478]|uniref:MFS transporter n=1 Tax=Nonomuraea sp. NPDC050478 TaxID=3364365 RepID=UPI0037A5C91D
MAPVLRLIRAAAFAAVCVVVSACGHLFAGGGAISGSALVISLIASFALALACNRRERTREAVLTATVLAQLVLHQTFAQVAPGGVTSTDHGHTNAGMALVHLTLALLSGWWLHQGESVVWTMLRLWGVAPLRLLLLVLASPVRAPRCVRPVRSADRSGPRRSLEFTAAVHRRGPPALARAG